MKQLINQLTTDSGIPLALIRIYLGIGLLVRGLIFVINPDIFTTYVNNTDGFAIPMIAIHYLILAHIGGGLLLALGLFTRIAALIQIPILLVAVLYVNSFKDLLTTDSIELSAIVLFLLIIFSIFGSTKLSALSCSTSNSE